MKKEIDDSLLGWGQNELDALVYFCPRCGEEEKDIPYNDLTEELDILEEESGYFML